MNKVPLKRTQLELETNFSLIVHVGSLNANVGKIFRKYFSDRQEPL